MHYFCVVYFQLWHNNLKQGRIHEFKRGRGAQNVFSFFSPPPASKVARPEKPMSGEGAGGGGDRGQGIQHFFFRPQKFCLEFPEVLFITKRRPSMLVKFKFNLS